jgi:uncharacterized delta-60 repeat protein
MRQKLLIAISVLMVSNTAVICQPGAPDAQFGNDGWVRYINDDNENGFEHMGIQPDGKIIVSRHGYLGRYNSNGTLDNSFGIDGWRRLDFTPTDFVVQSDGSILLLTGAAIYKHNASDGAVDLTWGDNGHVGIELFGVQLNYRSIALDNKGRIVVAGQATFGTAPNITRTTSVARLTPDGSLDTDFNGGGIKNQIFGDNIIRGAIDCGVDGEDKIVISVRVGDEDVGDAILKYNTDGKLDLGFGGGDGEIDAAKDINRLAVDVSGRIAFTTEPDPNALILAKIIIVNADGSFIDDHLIQFVIGLTAIDFQDDGKLVVAGYSSGKMLVMRMNSNGHSDPSFFSDNGRVEILPGSHIVPAELIYYNKRLFIAGYINVFFTGAGIITDANAFLLALDGTDKRLNCNTFGAGDLQKNTDAGKCYKTISDSKFDPAFIPSTATGTIQYKMLLNGNVSEQGTGTVSGKNFPVGQTQVIYTYTDITSHSCTFTVTISDKEAPTAKTKNINVQLNAAGTADIVATDVDDGSSDPCGIQSRSLSKTSFDCANVGSNTVTLTVKDASNNSATATATVTVEDKVAPETKCKNVTIYLDGTGKASINTSQIDNGSSDACGIRSLNLSKIEFDCSNKGNNTVTLTATDNNNNTSASTATVTVVDNLAPNITSVTSSPASLWPSDRKMKDVTINTLFTDNCPGTTYKISNVVIKEGEFAGDNVNPDWEITGDHTLKLRAEIPKKGMKRIYTVTVTCTDAAANTSTASTDVVVAHNITSPSSGATVRVGSTVSLSGEFWDKPGNKHTAKWVIDDKSVSGTLSEPSGAINGKVTGSYKFSTAGVYKLQMNVTDQNGLTTYANTYENLDAIVVVYDPNGGYAYGGGYFTSPKGALKSDPNASGDASYGFTLNYYKNATLPKGETQFKFNVGDFEFNALNFDYLVINNSMSQFKGTGKIIGGQSGVGFIMTVTDGQLDGTGIDKIRMKIYNKNNGSIIYDNQTGGSDAALPTQAVGANSVIVISGAGAGMTKSNTTQKTEMEAIEAKSPAGLEVVAFPNPSATDFTITVRTNSVKEKITMQVVDMYGRVIETKNVSANSMVRFGDRYHAGTYFVRILQGKQHKEIKLIKLSD